MRRRLLVGATALLLTVAPGCGNKNEVLGIGPPVNFCDGFWEFTYMDEPKPDDPGEVEAYAAGKVRVVDRIKLTFRIELKKGPPLKLPPNIGPDLKIVKDGMVRLRDDVRAAKGDKAKVREAVNRALLDESLITADERIVVFANSKCPDPGE